MWTVFWTFSTLLLLCGPSHYLNRPYVVMPCPHGLWMSPLSPSLNIIDSIVSSPSKLAKNLDSEKILYSTYVVACYVICEYTTTVFYKRFDISKAVWLGQNLTGVLFLFVYLWNRAKKHLSKFISYGNQANVVGWYWIS